MAVIRAHEFISLDGVFESPSWTMEFGFDPQMGETIGTLTDSADAILLGRKTHEMFAPAWRDRTTEDDPGAPFFNETEKFVVGTQEPAEDWNNTTRFGPYDAAKLRAFKESRENPVYISGSGQLVRAMIADGLLDELHLFMFPIALGTGDRLFADELAKFELKETHVYPNGVVHLCLVPRG
ncbi:deaminase [Nocardioides marmoriginsengisoli]|uniref:Deaminase n=1 Tax=Nocardioides marmoriginsengisoli TaxID=661483 RepID=A0A3N0CFE2_9ACTN|nr:dihydrofolate reductase family protein [Nocardioides marmoriginsengisoli]RNL62009.1 deaminase [Nocardioides marmoriginsengisoli]